MGGKNLVARNALVVGILAAISLAVLYLIVLTNLWWDLQGSFGHAMFHRLGQLVMGAEYMQGLSLLIVLSMAAGALTAYFSRAAIVKDRAAVHAGAVAGAVIACAFSVSAMAFFLFTSVGRPDFNLWYLATNLPMVLTMSLVLPAIVAMPSAAAGAVILYRNLTGGESPGRMTQGTALLVAVVATIAIAGLITAVISLNYNLPPSIPAIYSFPLLLTLPLLASGMNAPYKKGTIPVVIVILALSVSAIVALPLAGTALACNAGLITADAYGGLEHPPLPDVIIMAAANTSFPLIDLARNFSLQSDFDWGSTSIPGPGDEANLLVIEKVNASLCHLGVIGRNLTADEAALGLNQTVIGRNAAIGPVVFVTKGPVSANLTGFVAYAAGPEGQAILAKSSLVPY